MQILFPQESERGIEPTSPPSQVNTLTTRLQVHCVLHYVVRCVLRMPTGFDPAGNIGRGIPNMRIWLRFRHPD